MIDTAERKIHLHSGDNIKSNIIDDGKVILREYDDDAKNYAKKIFELYSKYALHDYGIVSTKHDIDKNTLIHEKHRISYPHEWTPSMYKDAVLYHIELVLILSRYGLTLKDALPENILFDGVKPVFVDFFSLVLSEDLKNEAWLMSGVPSGESPQHRVLEMMFVPFMLKPFLCYLEKEYDTGRILLDEYFCNSISRRKGIFERIRSLPLKKYLKSKLREGFHDAYRIRRKQKKCLKSMVREKSTPWLKRMIEIRGIVETCDIVPPASGYLQYYSDKKEEFGVQDFERWKDKQKIVYKLLQLHKPKTVLDIGCNTGWFSRLACKIGASVIATDMDVASIDALYREAKLSHLNILPLWMSFDDFTKERYSMDEEGKQHSVPFHMSATIRLGSDMVFCLGLFHHLTLGLGKSMEEVFKILASLTKQVLLLEFVDMKDSLVIENPDFFQNISKWNSDNYNQQEVIKEGLKHFDAFQILPSFPNTRAILVFKRGEVQ